MQCCSGHTISFPSLFANNETDFANMLTNMVKQVWIDKGLPEGTINKQVTNEFAKRLFNGVEKGYGKQLLEVDYNTPDHKMLSALQNNVWHFSAAKNYTQLKALSQALVDDQGKLRTYKQFKEEAFKINDQHINQHLKAEYELAVTSGRACSLWAEFSDDAILEFDAVMDGRTTDLCRSLNGTRLPKSHPFWKTYFIPNHYGERSTIKEVNYGKLTLDAEIPSADIPKMFQTNLAEAGLIFPDTHPYFKDLPNEVLSFGDANYKKDTTREQFSNLKGNVYESGLSFNKSKIKDERYYKEYLMRKHVADVMANHYDKDVFITPELDLKDLRYSYFFNDVPVKRKLPDLVIGKNYWEVESYEGSFKYGKISTMLRKGAEQSDRIVLKLKHKVDIDNIISRALGSISKSTKHLHNVKEVLIIDFNGKVHVIK